MFVVLSHWPHSPQNINYAEQNWINICLAWNNQCCSNPCMHIKALNIQHLILWISCCVVVTHVDIIQLCLFCGCHTCGYHPTPPVLWMSHMWHLTRLCLCCTFTNSFGLIDFYTDSVTNLFLCVSFFFLLSLMFIVEWYSYCVLFCVTKSDVYCGVWQELGASPT